MDGELGQLHQEMWPPTLEASTHQLFMPPSAYSFHAHLTSAVSKPWSFSGAHWMLSGWTRYLFFSLKVSGTLVFNKTFFFFKEIKPRDLTSDHRWIKFPPIRASVLFVSSCWILQWRKKTSNEKTKNKNPKAILYIFANKCNGCETAISPWPFHCDVLSVEVLADLYVGFWAKTCIIPLSRISFLVSQLIQRPFEFKFHYLYEIFSLFGLQLSLLTSNF